MLITVYLLLTAFVLLYVTIKRYFNLVMWTSFISLCPFLCSSRGPTPNQIYHHSGTPHLNPSLSLPSLPYSHPHHRESGPVSTPGPLHNTPHHPPTPHHHHTPPSLALPSPATMFAPGLGPPPPPHSLGSSVLSGLGPPVSIHPSIMPHESALAAAAALSVASPYPPSEYDWLLVFSAQGWRQMIREKGFYTSAVLHRAQIVHIKLKLCYTRNSAILLWLY